VLLAGGTLEALGDDRLDLASYFERPRRASGAEVLARVGELSRFAEVVEVAIERRSSPAIDAAWWLDLARRVQRLSDAGDLDGIVLAHGTNTLEETAWFLDLVVRTELPVVVTGSMRPSTAMSGDADLNLLNAVIAAANPRLRGAGVVVALNQEIHSARAVTKGSTHRLQAFESRNVGPLATVENDHEVVVRWLPRRPEALRAALGELPDELPRVEVVLSYVDAGGDAIDALVAAGARGIVLAGTGAGIGSPAQEEALERAQGAGVAVCIASRTGSGRVLATPARVRAGYVTADDLLPWKARILLALALTVTDDPAWIQAFFDDR
jgi:L-asparaginase